MRITTIIMVVFGLFVLSMLPYFLLNYFPWENGYKQGTSGYVGYTYARQLQSADECKLDTEVANDAEFQEACRAFFK